MTDQGKKLVPYGDAMYEVKVAEGMVHVKTAFAKAGAKDAAPQSFKIPISVLDAAEVLIKRDVMNCPVCKEGKLEPHTQDTTYLYVCSLCPVVMVEWHLDKDTKAFNDFMNRGKEVPKVNTDVHPYDKYSHRKRPWEDTGWTPDDGGHG